MRVVNLATAEHGGIDTWAWKESYTIEEQDEFVKTYFLPYLNVIKFCPSDNSVTGCFAQGTYKRLNGANWSDFDTTPYPKVLLSDGISIQFLLESDCFEREGRCLSWDVDVNGGKKPNMLGADSFAFNFFPQTGEVAPNGLIRAGSYDEETKTFEKIPLNQIHANCAGSQSNGALCAARVVLDGFKINYDW